MLQSGVRAGSPLLLFQAPRRWFDCPFSLALAGPKRGWAELVRCVDVLRNSTRVRNVHIGGTSPEHSQCGSIETPIAESIGNGTLPEVGRHLISSWLTEPFSRSCSRSRRQASAASPFGCEWCVCFRVTISIRRAGMYGDDLDRRGQGRPGRQRGPGSPRRAGLRPLACWRAGTARMRLKQADKLSEELTRCGCE